MAIQVEAIADLVKFAQDNKIELTIVGPEVPLSLGVVVDAFNAASLPILANNKRPPAQLESSKAFTKDFLARHNIPTADYSNFTEIAPAKAYAAALTAKTGFPVVIKADGLAAGKGVIICRRSSSRPMPLLMTCLPVINLAMRVHAWFIEEFLKGEEASFIVMVDGKNILANGHQPRPHSPRQWRLAAPDLLAAWVHTLLRRL
ncbi:hypothetical protein PEC18_34880 [Paucibacter sp. O1-1]|nr:hypothetical protein [Paucibacter sp. O1-1]MDA3830865.1 hypothetical protein [Paucibacter sp. O1-1]